MDYRELYAKARDLFNEAAASEDAEKRKDLLAQAEDVEQRAAAAKRGAGIVIDEPEPETKKPSKASLRDLMADQGYTDEQVKAVLNSLSPDKGGVKVGDDGERKYTFGDFLIAERNDDKAALKAMGARKDMEEGDGASGGYLVPTQQLNELLSVPDSEAVVRPRARIIPMARRSITIPALDQGDVPDYYWDLDYYGGVYSKWTEEGGAKHETEPEFKKIELVAHKLAGYTQASDELLDDSAIGLEGLLSTLFRGAIAMREDFAFLRGTGVGQPLGILNSGSLIPVARDTAGDVEWEDLVGMMARLIPSSRGRAVWVMSYTVLPELLTMEDTGNNNLFVPNSNEGIASSIPGTILGRPVVLTEKLPALGTEGDVLLADLSYYLIGDRQATTIQSSIHYAFINDVTTWRFVHRVDGQPWLDEAIYTDTTNTVSPFVALS